MATTASTASVDWADRIKSVDNLYWRRAFAECIEEAHDLLREPLLPSLYGIKCHIMLGKSSVDMIGRKKHKDTAEQLWALHASHWHKDSFQTTMVSEIKQELVKLAESIPRPNSSRLEDSFVYKRQRSQSASPRASRKMKVLEQHDFQLFESSRPSSPATEHQDQNVKSDDLADGYQREHQPKMAPNTPQSLPQESSRRAPGAPRITRWKSPENSPFSLF